MSELAIRVDNLSKEYRIGSHYSGDHSGDHSGGHSGDQRFGYRSLRDVLTATVPSLFSWPLRRAKSLRNSQGKNDGRAKEIIWALADLSFEIKRGEVVGIIGRNGAGKSTLLKILSRITEPTTGAVTLHGRVGSLLEVGTGFHPELTGRENIYLNGAILGMKRAEISRQFDAIVAFAEIETFLDTPVKHYSSGMYMRLAFAVAAHLEPEILLVDEVLAVGDAQFQKKCLGKMEDVAKEGRTVLFVSHNMAAMRALCRRGILLEAGQLKQVGSMAACIQAYLVGETAGAGSILTHLATTHENIELQSVTVNGKSSDEFHLSPETRTLCIEMRGRLTKPMVLEIEARIHDLYESPLAFFGPGHQRGHSDLYPSGEFHITRTMELPIMMHGQYMMTLSLTHPGLDVWITIPNALRLFAEGVVTSVEMMRDYYQGAGWIFLPDVSDQQGDSPQEVWGK